MPHLAIEWKSVFGIALAFSAVALSLPAPVVAQESDQVTFSKDIAPILQRSCQQCHRPSGVAPMPLVTYEDVQPHAMAMMRRTGIRDRQGTMPPWYVWMVTDLSSRQWIFSLQLWMIPINTARSPRPIHFRISMQWVELRCLP